MIEWPGNPAVWKTVESSFLLCSIMITWSGEPAAWRDDNLRITGVSSGACREENRRKNYVM